MLRRAVELGVTFIDTADSYGPEVSERLIREALHPYPDDLVIATKAGMTRPGPGRWGLNGRPEHLKSQAEKSLRLLGLERIELFQLHRIDPKVSLADQLGALLELRLEGKIGRIGLSQVSVPEIQAAQAFTPIATVQNRYNLSDRSAEPVLEFCQREGIGFIPWFPMATGRLAAPGGPLQQIADELAVTPGQLALAVAAQTLTGSAADPGHLDGRTPRRERGCRPDRAHRRPDPATQRRDLKWTLRSAQQEAQA